MPPEKKSETSSCAEVFGLVAVTTNYVVVYIAPATGKARQSGKKELLFFSHLETLCKLFYWLNQGGL